VPFSLTDRQRKVLIEHAFNSPAEEACGLICGYAGVEHVVVLPNVARDKQKTFEMTLKDVVDTTTLYGPILAVWHTHPSGDPLPSQVDLAEHPDGIALVIATSEEANAYATREAAA